MNTLLPWRTVKTAPTRNSNGSNDGTPHGRIANAAASTAEKPLLMGPAKSLDGGRRVFADHVIGTCSRRRSRADRPRLSSANGWRSSGGASGFLREVSFPDRRSRFLVRRGPAIRSTEDPALSTQFFEQALVAKLGSIAGPDVDSGNASQRRGRHLQVWSAANVGPWTRRAGSVSTRPTRPRAK